MTGGEPSYLTNNRAFIPNYGERYRKGKIISTGFAESAVNQVVSNRFLSGSRIASDFLWSRGKPHSCEIVTEKHVADGDDALLRPVATDNS